MLLTKDVLKSLRSKAPRKLGGGPYYGTFATETFYLLSLKHRPFLERKGRDLIWCASTRHSRAVFKPDVKREFGHE